MSGNTVRRVLAQSGLVPLDAQVLLAHVLGQSRAWLVAHADDPLGAEHERAFSTLAERRRAGEPVAYLTGTREFWGMEFAVSPAVLIPRSETETLVEVALAHLAPADRARVLDLGTGSGAIALALARERPKASIVATDNSAVALALAMENAARLDVHTVQFVQADWFDGIARSLAPFDLIVSNPPYVEPGDAHLREGDLRFEPAGALTPGTDGLAAIRRIVTGAPSWLAPGGVLAVEHGYDQAPTIEALFRAAGFEDVRTVRDLAGIPRVAFGRLAALTPP